MTFYELSFINPDDDPLLAENLKAKDFMCGHCNRIKISNLLVNSLSKFKNELNSEIYVILGYMCKELCYDIGEDPNNSHTQGKSVDVHFGQRFDLLTLYDSAIKLFPCVGIVKAVTGEFYFHLQQDAKNLYWLCGKKENDKESEYVYFRDNSELRKFIISRPEIFKDVKI
jgi:hypothetical protein